MNSIEYFSENLDNLSKKVFERQYALQPELLNRYGREGVKKTAADTKHNLNTLRYSIEFDSPLIFMDYINWLTPLLASRGVFVQDLKINLEIIRDVLKVELPQEIYPFIDSVIQEACQYLDHYAYKSVSFIDEIALHGELATRYLNLLMQSNRQEASQLILKTVNKALNIEDIYKYIFTPVQFEIGRMWQNNQINVAQEHYCTAVTQLIMSQLYPFIFNSKKTEKRLVAASVGGELHEIGVRMVADIFELNGWDTFYLGANMPDADILKSLEKYQAQVLAISITMIEKVDDAWKLIEKIRASKNNKIKVIVGGPPFNLIPDLWKKIGADGCESSAWAAASKIDALLNE
jgi:MerR family transcriptional regulator, light-induced transcriptional regulator